MANEKPPGSPGARRKRPPTVIDLEASEVVPRTAGAEPTLSVRAVTTDGGRVEVPVSYQWRSSRPSGALGDGDLVISPNPTLGNVEVRFRLASASRVEISVHDLSGRKVRSLFTGAQDVGEHSVKWDGRDNAGALAPLGVYFVNVRLGHQARSERLVLMR